MVLYLIAALLISIVGMAAILSLKRYEMNSGRVVFASVRPSMSVFFHHVLATIRALPLVVRYFARYALYRLKVMAQRLIAQAALGVEYMLERWLHIVREKTAPPSAQGEASAFLREVADHKRELLKRSRKERQISE